MAVTVTLEPAGRCRWDEPVRIVVRGLGPGQPVTLRASLRDEKGALFRAHARYCADAAGLLDLERAPALGGSFAGLEPMGLFWALEPEKPLLRLVKRDVQTPFAVELEVLDGHEPEAQLLLGRAVHERDFLAPGVRREPVRAGRVRGTLFLPPGSKPFPGILDLFGSSGGLCEYRASLLAGHGFAVLALAYFRFEDLPEHLNDVCLEYFEEAVDFMLQHPKVKGPGVGLLGFSKGELLCMQFWANQYSMEVSQRLTQKHKQMPGSKFKLSSINISMVKNLSGPASCNTVIIDRILIKILDFPGSPVVKNLQGTWFQSLLQEDSTCYIQYN
ncbi:acyl-coenzyme A thioesterase 6 isoform X2 [Odocoileus virginianus]|uniref:Acyl-coenzyme A thioesterase 6 isoform X2 n=1 Tax=Odocoileus virginianus TaxID=9874 RepID=A0ABM4ID13_ODOVR